MAKRDDLINVRQRSYLARDFSGFRANLLEYARTYHPNNIKDFSEGSLGGLFLDFASIVGDNLSFYQDHQFNELDPANAVETKNIERLLAAANVPIVGAAPAVADVTVYVQVPAAGNDVDRSALPVVQAGSIFSSDDGIDFILVEDINFGAANSRGELLAEKKLVGSNSYVVSMSGVCVSGKETTETFTIDGTFIPFRKVTLAHGDVSEVVDISDSLGNTYYQVGSLAHDVVYRNVANTASDKNDAPGSLKVVPAPYRCMPKVDLSSRRTSLIFGGGNADTLEDDIIPDPSDFAIPLPYGKTFSRISINPEKLLETKTLGVAAINTTVSVTYRYGGGLDHNAGPGSIKNIKTLLAKFPGNPANNVAASIRGSIEVANVREAAGGDDAPDVDELKSLISATKNAQERIVTRPDLLARVYSLPANFGRVFRASVRSNPNNPLATQLFILSRTPDKKLTIASDSLKNNLVKYLNPYRMISDAVDILDARVINLQFMFDIIADPSLNSATVMQGVLTRLQSTFDIKNFHIDQPIILSEVMSAIYASGGVVSVNNLKFVNLTGMVNNRLYSDASFDVASNTKNGVIFGAPGSIFEIRFPEVDIIGKIT